MCTERGQDVRKAVGVVLPRVARQFACPGVETREIRWHRDDFATPSEFIERGKHVLLMLGPCGVCNRHKGRILKTILSQDLHLVSHVVVDSRTAGYLVKLIDQGLV